MTSEEQSKRFYEILSTIKNLHDAKRHDYGAKEDIFANFRLSNLAGISPWKGSVIRMGDKYSRIASFIKNGDFKFKEESIKDTLMDMAIYSLITIILYEEEMFNLHIKTFEEQLNKEKIMKIEKKIEVLKETIAWFRKQIEPHDCGWIYTTIDGIKHRISALRKELKKEI